MSRPLPAGAVLLAATFIALGAAFGAGHHPASAANASVSIVGFAFSPGTVTVSIGDTVTWMNNDASVPHTVSSDSGSELASGQLAGGASYQKTFSAAGSYAYHCDIHPSMTGLVAVTGAAATATSTLAPTSTPAATPTPAPTVTATATLAATNTPTATTAAATATSPAAATNTPTAAGGTTPTAAASPTSAPQPPATGDGDAGDDDTATVVTSGIVAIAIVLAVGAVVYMVRRRRQFTS
ncbi:MAG: cupredoxin domain-containing protein [Dehalococcoidia bacterium]|nr:cupredoxin domain-containing protein [Dehalococcoidia bacterium]